MPSGSQTERLAGSLPDVPRLLYARSMLLSGRCEVLGLEGAPSGPSFVARELEDREDRWFCVVGRPSGGAIREAARRNRDGGEVLAAREGAARVAEALPGLTATRVVVHLLGDDPRLPPTAGRDVGPFAAPDLDAAWDDLPDELRSYLEGAIGRRGAPVAASLVDGRPVSVCCAEDETEGLWDIAIETLEGHRRGGHAARCVSWMVGEMGRRGKEPVWAAEETNPASMRLAAKLGFVPADELVLFQPASQPGVPQEQTPSRRRSASPETGRRRALLRSFSVSLCVPDVAARLPAGACRTWIGRTLPAAETGSTA